MILALFYALQKIILYNQIIFYNWETHYNDYSGAIEYRDAWTAIAVKRTDGSCAIFYMAIRQDYTGSGYGATKYGAMGDSEDIPCENVSK